MKKPNSTKTLFLVELVMPPMMTSTAMCYYIKQAIQAEVGHCHPDDAMFNLDRETVKVKNAGKVLSGLQGQMTAAKTVRKELRNARQDR